MRRSGFGVVVFLNQQAIWPLIGVEAGQGRGPFSRGGQGWGITLQHETKIAMTEPCDMSKRRGGKSLFAALLALHLLLLPGALHAGWGSPDPMDAAKAMQLADGSQFDEKAMGKRFGRFMESFVEGAAKGGKEQAAPPESAAQAPVQQRERHRRAHNYDPWGARYWGYPGGGYDPWGAGNGYGALRGYGSGGGWGGPGWGAPPGYGPWGGFPPPRPGYGPPPGQGRYAPPSGERPQRQEDQNPRRDYANPGAW